MRSWAGTGAAFRDLSAVGGSEDPRVTVFITGKHMGGSLGFREISRSLIFEAVSLRDPPGMSGGSWVRSGTGKRSELAVGLWAPSLGEDTM